MITILEKTTDSRKDKTVVIQSGVKPVTTETNEIAVPQFNTLEDWLLNPIEGTEWVDDKLQEKSEVTMKHSKVQGNVYFYWRNHILSHELGGKVFVEVSCRTDNRGRKPDVAYVTPELLEQFGEPSSFPQSFPLIAEVISPHDYMEEAIAKSQEYLSSGAEEVWLVLPEAQWIIIITKEAKQIFTAEDIVSTQKVLLGFSLAVQELWA